MRLGGRYMIRRGEPVLVHRTGTPEGENVSPDSAAGRAGQRAAPPASEPNDPPVADEPITAPENDDHADRS